MRDTMERPATGGPAGLEGVIAAETGLSGIDGETGELWIAGEPVGTFARRTFVDAAMRLLRGTASGLERTEAASESFATALGAARAAAHRRLPQLGDALDANDAMGALQAGLAHLPRSAEAAATGIAVLGTLPDLLAAWARRRRGLEPIAPRPGVGHAADLLTLLEGEPPTAPRAEALGTYLATVMDHGLNASTFTARVVASTGSDPVAVPATGKGASRHSARNTGRQ